MQPHSQIRLWPRIALGLCSLAWPAPAQTAATIPPKKPASASPSAKAKHAAGAPTASKASKSSSHTSSRPRAGTSSRATASAQKSKGSRGKKGSKQVAKKRGQQAIDSDRAREIQTALIREHYMEGEPTSVWDSATQAAMQRYQAAQGWQSKTTPDSRALIKLGLGPSKDHLLNPENAMTTPPAADPRTSSKQTPQSGNLPQQ
jgi:Putative peptidoglycan binding domain